MSKPAPELAKNAIPAAVKQFHDHLDRCRQCSEHPMQLCRVGNELLKNSLRAK